MAYGDFKYLPRRTISEEISHNKTFNIAKILTYDRYQGGLASMVYNFFDKKLLVVLLKMKICQTSN